MEEERNEINRYQLLHENELLNLTGIKKDMLKSMAQELQLEVTGKRVEHLAPLVKFNLTRSPSSGELFNSFYDLTAVLALPIRLTAVQYEENQLIS
jgi:hypothetical protein